jgi:hypothetical protein
MTPRFLGVKNLGPLLLLLLTLFGCSGSAVEGQPVSLPVPFSGALTPESRVVVSNGDPLAGTGPLSLRRSITKGFSNVSWDLFNSDGSHAGIVTYHSTSPQSLVPQQNGNSFNVPVTLAFDDGSIAGSNAVLCYDFDYPIDAPNDPTVQQTKGVCSGIVDQATGSMASALGKTMDHRYVYLFKIVNGQRVFDKINWGPWIIHR